MVSNVRTAGIGVGLLVGLTLSVLLMSIATASAQAETTGSCQDQFDMLQQDTQTLIITGGKVDKERAGLVKLVDDAQTLASIGKTSDAVKKLGDFTVRVDQLEAAGRISAENAGQLRTDAQAAISCLQGSEASSTVGAVN